MRIRLAALLVIAGLPAVTAEARAGRPFAVAGAGAAYLDKQTPFEVSGGEPVLTLGAGADLTPRSAAGVRAELYPLEDATNVAVTLTGEVRLGPYAGVLAAAGISGTELSRLGGVLGIGGFGRWAGGDRLALRFEVLGARESRSDFSGYRVGASVVVEVSWP